MDAAIISLLATLIATMFGGFWLLWRTIHKDNTAIRKEMAEQNISIRQYITEQNTSIRQDIADLRQDHARLEATMETLLKLIPTLVNPESSTPGDVQPGSAV